MYNYVNLQLDTIVILSPDTMLRRLLLHVAPMDDDDDHDDDHSSSVEDIERDVLGLIVLHIISGGKIGGFTHAFSDFLQIRIRCTRKTVCRFAYGFVIII